MTDKKIFDDALNIQRDQNMEIHRMASASVLMDQYSDMLITVYGRDGCNCGKDDEAHDRQSAEAYAMLHGHIREILTYLPNILRPQQLIAGDREKLSATRQAVTDALYFMQSALWFFSTMSDKRIRDALKSNRMATHACVESMFEMLNEAITSTSAKLEAEMIGNVARESFDVEEFLARIKRKLDAGVQ